MAIKDEKELSMDEILASIRSILHESGNVRHADTEEIPYTEPSVKNSGMTVSKRPEIEVPELGATEPVFEPQSRLAPAEDMQDDVAAICSNIQKLMQQPGDEETARFTITVDEVEPVINKDVEPAPSEVNIAVKSKEKSCSFAGGQQGRPVGGKDISAQILDSFAAVFARRRQNRPLVDMSARDLAESAVINEVVPVLAQWLNDCLPDIIQKEIERVMVKAGNR